LLCARSKLRQLTALSTTPPAVPRFEPAGPAVACRLFVARHVAAAAEGGGARLAIGRRPRVIAAATAGAGCVVGRLTIIAEEGGGELDDDNCHMVTEYWSNI
jgi:hypothetical protein